MTGRRVPASALLFLALAPVAVACGASSNSSPLPPPTTTGSGGTGTKPPPPPPSGDVTVHIDLPAADPVPVFAPGTLVDVSAHVTIANGTDYVDSASVRMTVTAQGGDQVLEKGTLILSGDVTMPDVYTGRISLGDLPSGTYTIKVTAASSGGAKGSNTVDFEIDSVPVVVVNSPVGGKSYRRGVTIEVIATDTFLLADAPTATVGDLPVVLSPSGVPDTYRGAIDFDKPTTPAGVVEPPLFGDQLLTVVATNTHGRKTEVQLVFTIDNDGPTITNTNPFPGQVVGGVTEISALIQDNAGILDSSVIAVISDDTDTTKMPLFTLPLKSQGAGVYSALFDSAQLTQCPDPPATGLCIVFPTISFRASDLLENETVVSYGFGVDNVAPVADLDPPNLRDEKIDDALRCSWEFDPVGNDNFNGDMPNDLKMVPQVFDLRARIEDDGNRAAGLKFPPLSFVNPDTTAVYVLDDETLPLIVDTDGNGTCDSINPLLVPTTQPPRINTQVLKVRLGPVPGQGAGDFTPDPSLPLPYCARGADTKLPAPPCKTLLEPSLSITYALGVPAIWSIDPIRPGLDCMGGQFDTLANNIGEGWACIAVATTDNIGNFSVSAPLRVYISYDYDKKNRPNLGYTFGADPPAGAGPPPACTGIYDKTTKMVTAGACTTRKFRSVPATGADYVCYLGDCQLPLP